MKKRMALGAALMLLMASCGGGGSGPQERTIRVDFSHDEFGSFFTEYFPREVKLHAGDTAVFKQTWTGEPHSVTMGTMVDDLMEVTEPYIEAFEKGTPLPEEEPPEVEAKEQLLPPMFGEGISDVTQNGGRPCFLETGTPPSDPETPCKQVKQPAFDGKQTYYNSGFIPYEGSGQNEFKVPLAGDIAPGTYFFYCNYHGPLMSGKIDVVGKDARISSQDELNKAARDRIDKESAPLREALDQIQKGTLELPPDVIDAFGKAGFLKPNTKFFQGNISGIYAVEDDSVQGGINEFVPKQIEAKVGEKVKWASLGMHTISFNVPRYFPVISVQKDGKVVYNPKVIEPAGGVPAHPGPYDFEGPPPEDPLVIDGGTWDGEGFYSTGLIGWDPFVKFEMAFSRPGTYKYACLIHPPMTGTVVVR